MFVRLALESDADTLVEMARMNAAETRASLTFNEDKMRETIRSYIDKASPTFFVVEERREVLGFLVADFYEYRAFDGLFTTQEVMFVRPDKRGTRASVLLMKNLIAWSERLGAKEIIGGNDNEFNSERTAKFLEHFGFERVGFSMRRAV
jgi:L-amino acid N-acyltransferase YncA